MTLIQLVEKALIANELSGLLSAAYRFSDPDGILTGKSGYSFGTVQYDVLNNPTAIICLQACGFTPEEIERVKSQKTEIDDLNTKLKANSATVDLYDAKQIAYCVSHVQGIIAKHGLTAASDIAMVCLCDYDNQFHFSDLDKPGYLLSYLEALHRPFTDQDILLYKLRVNTWGKAHQADVERRYNNIAKIFQT